MTTSVHLISNFSGSH